MSSPYRLRAIFWLLIATICWSMSFPLVKILYIEQGSRLPSASVSFLAISFMAARFGMAALLLLPWVLHKIPTFTRNEWRQGLVLALCGGGGMCLQADALAYTSSSTCAFITQTYCVFLPIYHCMRLRQWPSFYLILATTLVFAGMTWLSGASWQKMTLGRGEWETFLAAIVFTGQILCLENPRYRENRSAMITWIMFLGITIIALPLAMLRSQNQHDVAIAFSSWPATLLVLTMALLCSVFAFGLMNRWQKCISALEAGLLYCSEPLFTSIIALFAPSIIGIWIGRAIDNEVLTPAIWIGGSLIIAAILLTLSAQRTINRDS
jgi:drug/metabolite transporter (DMT)-like permease